MNFVPVELEPWNPLWLLVFIGIMVLLVIIGIFILDASEDVGFGFIAVGIVVGLFGSIFGGLMMSSQWDSGQKHDALVSDGFTHVEYSVDGGYVASDDGEFVRIEFLTVDGQQGYTVISDGKGD